MEIILKAERVLFGEMVIIAKNRQLHMRDALCRPLGPLLQALSTANGQVTAESQRGSSTSRELQKNAPAVGEIFQPSARVIDGMVLVLRLKSDHKKFSDISESFSRRDLMFSLVCIERIQLRGMQKESIEGLSMEINSEICNPTIKCSSGKRSLLIHRKESLNNFYFAKEQKQDKRDNFVFYSVCTGCSQLDRVRLLHF